MDEETKMKILKRDLQMLTNTNDEYLRHLLELADELMQREGIRDTKSIEYEAAQIQYAAYLFRKRAGSETAMPRYLRYELNNLLFSQKAGGK